MCSAITKNNWKIYFDHAFLTRIFPDTPFAAVGADTVAVLRLRGKIPSKHENFQKKYVVFIRKYVLYESCNPKVQSCNHVHDIPTTIIWAGFSRRMDAMYTQDQITLTLRNCDAERRNAPEISAVPPTPTLKLNCCLRFSDLASSASELPILPELIWPFVPAGASRSNSVILGMFFFSFFWVNRASSLYIKKMGLPMRLWH